MLGLALVGCDGPESEIHFRNNSILPDGVNIEVGPSAETPQPSGTGVEVHSCANGHPEEPLTLAWADFEADQHLAEGANLSALPLTVKNLRDEALTVLVHVEGDGGTGATTALPNAQLELGPQEQVTHLVDAAGYTPGDGVIGNSGALSVWATVSSPEGTASLLGASAPPLFFHLGTGDTVFGPEAGTIATIYDRHALSQTYRGGDLLAEMPEDVHDGYEYGPPVPSRVVSGTASVIVTSGRTTPSELADAGLLPSDVADAPEVTE